MRPGAVRSVLRGNGKRPGLPIIDWSHPLTAGLLACYVPVGGYFIPNLTGLGGNLVVRPASTLGASPEGITLVSGAVTNAGASANAPASFQVTNGSSLYWRGTPLGAESGAGPTLIGVATGNGSSPFDAYTIDIPSALADWVQPGWNSGGSFSNVQVNVGFSAYNSIKSLGVTFQPNGNVITYGAGASLNSTSFGASAPTYSTPHILLGCHDTVTTRYTNAGCLIGMIWGRVLTATEMLRLHFDPYCFLIFPEDRVFASLARAAAVAPPWFDMVTSAELRQDRYDPTPY